MMNARFWTGTIAAGTTALLLVGCSAPQSSNPEGEGAKPYDGQELVVTSFGGDWEAAFIEAVVDPFEQETGASVQLVTLYSADALVQLTAQAERPQLDVVLFSGGQEVTAAEAGLLEPIAAAELSNYSNLQPVAVEGLDHGYGPIIQVTPFGLVYNTEKIAEPPSSWLDILDPRFAGHVALTDLSNSYGILSLLSVNNALGSPEHDAEAGLETLGALAASGDAIVISTSSDLQAAFGQRDIWLAPYAQDYAETLRQAGVPVGFARPTEGFTASFITANVVAGRENTELAKLFVDSVLSAEAQTVFANRMRYSPVNTQAEISDEVSSEVLNVQEFQDLIRYDAKTIADNRAVWTEQWNALIIQ